MNLVLRIASALVLLPIVLAVIHLGGWYAFGLCIVVAGTSLYEYGKIVLKDDALARGVLLVVGTSLSCGLTLIDKVPVAVGVTMLASIAITGLFVVRTGDFDTAWRRMATTGFALLYISLGVYALVGLRQLGEPLPSEWQRPTWLYIALLVTWANDTFAYFTGRAIGKHKFYPKVSPNKTWEGAIGGVVGAVGMLFVIQLLFPNAFSHFTAVDFLIIGIPGAALGPLGDLAESLLKRNYDVKDSGNTIPGHGGMLDRVDALLFVTPWVLLYGTGIRPLLG